MANTITVRCPNCSNEMRASVKHIGRKGKCSSCGTLVTIRAEDEEQQSTATLYGADEDEGSLASGTGANPLLAGLIGLGVTVVLYIGFYAVAKSSGVLGDIGVFMTKRSIVQHMIVFVTAWGLAILLLKYLAVKRELRSTERELELIPLEIGVQITSANADKFLDHLRRLTPEEQNSILARRIRGALEHLKHRNNVAEVQSYLATQADIEASAVDSGYTLMRVFLWLCPILGFIGTVVGIGEAVMGLSKALPEPTAATAAAQPGKPPGEDMSKLMAGMRGVTDGLATAFDTTLLGLLTVVILMFPNEALKKIEYDMLDRVQAFANDSLLRRMADSGGGETSGMPEIVQKSLDAAFKEHQRWLAQWQAQVAQLGNMIGADFESHFGACQEKLTQGDGKRLEALNTSARRVEELFGQLQSVTVSWEKSGSQEFRNSLSAAAELQHSLQSNTAAMSNVIDRQSKLMETYSRSDLQGVLQALADAVARLGGERPRQSYSPPAPELLTRPSDGSFPTPSMAPDFVPLSPAPPDRNAGNRKPGFFGRILGRGD